MRIASSLPVEPRRAMDEVERLKIDVAYVMKNAEAGISFRSTQQQGTQVLRREDL